MSSGEGSARLASSAPAAAAEPSSSRNAGATSSQSETIFQAFFAQGDYEAIAELLEREELEATNGIPASQVYERLLAIYLLQNDFYNAKLLWKRIPAPMKPADSELAAIWAVAQKVSRSDFAGIYEMLRRPWSNGDNEMLMNRMVEETRRRAVELVAKAYESIALANLGALLGTSGEAETRKAASELKWVVEGDMVYPSARKVDEESRKFVSGDAHLGLLTDYVSFLESH